MGTKKVGREVAFKELKGFLNKHKAKEFRRGTLTDEKIEDDYIDVLEAIEDGLMIFKDNSPVYTLREPVKSDNGNVVLDEVVFRTRIHPVDRTNVLNGINLEKEQGTYLLKTLSLATQLSVPMLSKLGKEDFEVLNQVSQVF